MAIVLSDKAETESELRAAGDLWAEHVLENAKAYIMTFVYIFATVISGFPLFSAIAYGAGLDKSSIGITWSVSLMQHFTSGCHKSTLLSYDWFSDETSCIAWSDEQL